jgi:RNA recognition motif-containing protein
LKIAGYAKGLCPFRFRRKGSRVDKSVFTRFAFVDFTTIEHATSVLINPRNHRLDGRKLVVEYASPDAVRRGGGPRPKGSVNERSKGEKQASKGENKKRKHEETEEDTQADHEQGDEKEDGSTWPKKSFKGERSYTQKTQGRSGSRPKPGAALALAKRESAAIVPGAGKKIVF